MTKATTIRIATRASALALWQAHHTADLLTQSGVASVEIVEVSTVGDRDKSEPLSTLSTSIDGAGTGVFTREVQRAVLDGRADIAVHSLKDLPTESAEGLALAGLPPRAVRFDRLVFPAKSKIDPATAVADSLPQSARVGTGALRRQAQLLHHRPDLKLAEIRGNVETRLKKLDDGEYDAIILASAGLDRLGFENWPTIELRPPVMWPAVGQAALGIECRDDDTAVITALQRISDPIATNEVTAERSMLRTLRAGCHAPVGALSRSNGKSTTLEGVVLSPDGATRLIRSASGRCSETVGQRVAELLIAAGAKQYL